MKGEKPDGPFYDYDGMDANTNVDHGPMIIAPYKFSGHSGWQGVSHCTIFDDGAGQYYIAHQGRPGVDKYYMDLHIRKLFWTPDGWPVASPERYAWEKDSVISQGDLTIAADGTLSGNTANTWTYSAPWLQLKWSNGTTEKVFVQKGRDWENRKNTIIFTGLNNAGIAVWGKKK